MKKALETFEKWFLIGSLVVMVSIVFMQVILRWIGNPTVWAEELTRYIMLYQVWIGAAYAVNEDAHIQITAVINHLTGKKKKNLELIVLTIWLIFAAWLTVEGFSLVGKIAAMGQISSALQIPMAIPYASVPVGGALMIIHLIEKIYGTLEGKEAA